MLKKLLKLLTLNYFFIIYNWIFLNKKKNIKKHHLIARGVYPLEGIF